MKKNWDVLIILDACRYDLFESVYRKVYPNRLNEIRRSPATYTAQWLSKMFTVYHDDIVYVSANPWVNSGMRVRSRIQNWIHVEYGDFDARKHFFKVIDVWKEKEKFNHATLPEKVNEAFMKYYLRYPRKKFILHYMQPHRPYVTTPKTIHFTRKNELKRILPKNFFSLSMIMNWKIKKCLFKKPTSYEEEMYRDYGHGGLKAVYMGEIVNVLEHVKRITDSLNLDFIITSDHGERLGEHWWLKSHGPGPRHKEVVQVPWLEIRKRRIHG